jgi:pimeloyl-ACP methyl ester carboxylesterase
MLFTISSDEGLPIHGNLDLPPHVRGLVVVVHGFKGFKDWGFFPWLSEYLCAQRFGVCRFNMSRSGVGEGSEDFDRLDLFADDTYTAQIADLRAVIRHVQSQHALPLFLLGHSRGGGVALLGAREVPLLRGVITWSAISHADRWDPVTKAKWRQEGHMDVVNARTRQIMRMSPRILDDYDANSSKLDILAATQHVGVPLLVIHGGRDESVPVAEAAQIAAAAPDASHLVIANASHTYNAIHPLVHVPAELALAAAVTARFVAGYA